MTLRTLLALTLVAVVPGISLAQPAKTELPDDRVTFNKDVDAMVTKGGLTADAAAKMASKVSPAVARSAAEIEISIAQAQAAELVRVPQIAAKAAYTRLSPLDTVVFGDPSVPGTPSFPALSDVFTIQGQLAVPLSDYVLRYPKIIDAARLGLEVARTSQRSTEVNAGQEARVAYYEWVRSRLQVLIAERQLAQVQATVKQMRALAEVQRLSRADLMRVESQEAQADQTLIQLRHLAVLREEQLRLLIGTPDGQPLTMGEDPRDDLNPPAAGQLDALMDTAKHQRLEFRVFDIGILAKEKQRLAEKANLYPKLSAFAAGEYTNPNPRIFPQAAEFTFTYSFGLQLTWTLNDTLLAKTTQRRIRGEMDVLRADRDNLERGTRVQVLAAQQQVLVAQAGLQTSQKGLDAAEESYRVRRELLSAERATAVELVDAQTDLTRARIAALNARIDLRVAMVALAHALGNDTK